MGLLGLSWSGSTGYRRILLPAAVAGMALLAAASTWVAAGRALSDDPQFGSKDFQWSPTRLFLQGSDPYQASLDGTGEIILTQSPNYLHLLYEVLTPFGLLPFGTAKAAWLVLTLGLAVALAVFYARVAGLGRGGTALLVTALIASTPMRLGLSVGQHAVFLLAAATVAFARSDRSWAGVPLALAVTKYSFAPLGLVVLAAGRLRTAAVAGATLLAAAALFAVVTSTAFVTVLLAPFRVAQNAVGSGAADLMTVAALIPWLDGNETLVSGAAVVVASALTCAVLRQVRTGDWVFGLGLASLISLLCFTHLAHDLVFLLPVVVLALRMRGGRALAAWVVLAWHAFVVGIISELGTPYDAPPVVATSFVLTAVLFVLVAGDQDAPRPCTRGRVTGGVGTPALGG